MLNSETMEEEFLQKVADEQISCVAFSPDDSIIAAGSWDQYIHVLKYKDGKLAVSKKMKVKGAGNNIWEGVGVGRKEEEY